MSNRPRIRFNTDPIREDIPVAPLPLALQKAIARVEDDINDALNDALNEESHEQQRGLRPVSSTD